LPPSSHELLAYADGSCIGNPGPGGWGFVIVRPGGEREESSGGDPATTNNKMELTAAIEALKRIEPGRSVVLRSDSQYVVKGINEKRKRKANLELWGRLDAEIAARRVTFQWVRGHADDPLNARADELAHSEAERIARGDRAAARSPQGRDPARGDPIRELEPLLREDETIRKCAGCGRMFVSKRALHCTQVECQLAARRAAGG
jgi:ribonuclease HI